MNHLKLSKEANEAARKIDLVVSREINNPDVVLSMDAVIRIASIVQIAINRKCRASSLAGVTQPASRTGCNRRATTKTIIKP